MTGHSYIVYGPMLAGCTQVFYEGAVDFPNPGRVWKTIEKYGVTILYTAPTAIRALMRQGDNGPPQRTSPRSASSARSASRSTPRRGCGTAR